MSRLKFTSYPSAVALVLIIVGLLASSHTTVQAQVPLENRSLTGSADFGDKGRHIGINPLGTISITGEELDSEVGGGTGDAHTIRIGASGYAFLPNGIVLRNSGSEMVFDGPGQTRTLDVLFMGTGAYNVSNFSLPTNNQYTNGSNETVQSLGGHWHWQGDYNKINGDTATIEVTDARFRNDSTSDGELYDLRSGISPVDLTSKFETPETSPAYNRTNASRPTPLSPVKDGISSFNLIEDQDAIVERRNALLTVDTPPPVAEGDPEHTPPTLDLSQINVSAQGTSLQDRELTLQGHHPFNRQLRQIDAGRFMVGGAGDMVSVSSSDSVLVETYGDDDTRTRLQLGNFSSSSTSNKSTASLGLAADFDDALDTATINTSVDFGTVSRSTLGTVRDTVNFGGNISGEGLTGENVQLNLAVEYSYGIVAENGVVADDITYFVLDNANTSGLQVSNHTLAREFSTDTHTKIGINSAVTLNNAATQSVTKSVGNGVFAEGLTGETVSGATTFQVHRKSVQGSILSSTPDGSLDVDELITISNDRVADAGSIQAEALFTSLERVGSTRWSLPESRIFDNGLAAGESITLTPTFNESGLDPEATLGRNYRTRIVAQVQDGVRDLDSHLVAGTSRGTVSGVSALQFNILGSNDTKQTMSWTVERNDVVQGSSGTTTLAAGSTLFGEGINLTNSGDNTGAPNPTSLRILDSQTLAAATNVSVNFIGLNDTDSENAALRDAAGYDTIVSDIVQIEGLDGVLHVVDLSFDPSSAGSGQLLWLDLGDENDAGDDLWANAILGNSNVLAYSYAANSVTLAGGDSSLSQFLGDNFQGIGSYLDYLESVAGGAPELGAYGVDRANNSAWAVIDHNSSFSVAPVPEPTGLVIFEITSVALMIRRRR